MSGGDCILTVLLVDDDPALLEMLVQIAQRSREMTIMPAQSGKEALKILATQSFDVIITDYAMPGMDGIALIRKIRSDNDGTPVILYSDEPDDRIAVSALNSGASYYLRKGKDPRRQFHELTETARTVSSQGLGKRVVAITSRVITDLINFSSDPCYAIDRDGKVIAWNDSMEQLSDVPAEFMIGKGDHSYAEPFHGRRKKVLADLIFASDDEIRKANYLIISRVKNGPVIAVTRGVAKDGSALTLWTKAMPVFDTLGNFLAVVGTVRDVTATFGDIVTHEPVPEEDRQVSAPAPPAQKRPANKFLKKLLNTATSRYKEGVTLFHTKDYRGAIAAFDRANEIDDALPYVWNDRGICYRELGDHTHALKSCLRAVELAPESPQCLFTLGEVLEQIGIMYHSTKYLDSAIQTFRMVVNQLPNNANAWTHMGICYREMGRPEESKFHLDRARDIRLGGKDTPIRYTRDDYT